MDARELGAGAELAGDRSLSSSDAEEDVPLLEGVAAAADRVLAGARASRRRPYVVGLAGVPGAGKSTFAAALATALRAALASDAAGGKRDAAGAADTVAVLSMDGFHLPRASLSAADLARRGAPWTFDAAAFVERLAAVRGMNVNGDDAGDVPWPAFDHAAGDAAPGPPVSRAAAVVIVEGLYVLLPSYGFGGAAGLLDDALFLDTPRALARARLRARHVAAWGLSRAAADARIDANDALNAELVRPSVSRARARVRDDGGGGDGDGDGDGEGSGGGEKDGEGGGTGRGTAS